MSNPQALRKRMLAHVEIPPSPHNLSKYQPFFSPKSSRVERAITKENMFLSLHSNDSSTAYASRKRKAAEDGTHSRKTTKLKQDALNPAEMVSRGGAEPTDFPNGYVYCHQCSQKRDVMASIQCTNMTLPTSGKKPNIKRCSTKYCKTCLKNRYGEGIDQIKNGPCSSTKAGGHVEGLGYTFKCPKCRNMCNCSRCRRLQGLEPTGKAEKGHAKRESKVNVNAPRSLLQRKKAPQLSFEPVGTGPKWTRLHTSLDQPAAEDRIYIREFMLRFGRIMNPPVNKSHLGELELIGGGVKGREEYEDMSSWVSETCVGSMILGTLSLLAPECYNAEVIKSAMKEIRSMGSNLTKVWSALQQLRETHQSSSSASNGGIHLEFPDPLPPPSSAVVHQTRSMRSAENTQRNVYILCSGQMVPVLIALINLATVTIAVREEIGEGLRDAKKLAQTSKEATRLVNEKWEKTRESFNDKAVDKVQKKALRDICKRRLLSIEKASVILTSSRVPRFTGLLGRDHRGRVYWTISPSMEEVTAAHQFITSVSGEEMPEAGANTNPRREQSDPKALGNVKEWSWFLAVWGQPPTDNEGFEGEDSDDDDNDIDGRENWWAFDDVDEIRKIALRLCSKNETAGSETDIPTLSKRIMEFADLLEWRNRPDRYD